MKKEIIAMLSDGIMWLSLGLIGILAVPVCIGLAPIWLIWKGADWLLCRVDQMAA